MDCSCLKGFTLTESLFSLALTSILITTAIPEFSHLLKSNRLGSQSSHFITAYNLARHEAIKSNQKIVLCPRINATCGNHQQWHNGWLIYNDTNLSNTPESNEIIQRFDPLDNGYQLSPNIAISSLHFLSNGQARKENGSLPMATFILCSPNATAEEITESSRELVINASGRIRLQKGRRGITRC